MNTYTTARQTWVSAGSVYTEFACLVDDGASGIERSIELVGVNFADTNTVRAAVAAALVLIYGDAVTAEEVVLANPSSASAAGIGVAITLRGDGYYRPATGVDIVEPVDGMMVSNVVLRREIAGTGGTTEIDILVNGVSLWSVTPANRPKILFSDGDGARVVSGPPDNPNIAVGARIEMDILSAEDGNPQDLVAILRGA